MIVLGLLWALPTTLLGLLLAGLGGARPYKWRPAYVWQWTGEAFFWRWFFGLGWGAITFGAVTIFSPANKDSEVMVRHERQHTLQALWLGPLFLPAYLVLWAMAGFKYRENPLEVAAYAAESKPDAWG